MSLHTSTYSFSFVGLSLRVKEFVSVAKSRLQGVNFDPTLELSSGKSSTSKRFMSEINKRLDLLTTNQTKLLVEGNLIMQKQIAFLSMCKAYSYFYDFVVEVLRDKVLLFDYTLSPGEYVTFYRRKCEQHFELESLADSTQYKIKQVLFRSLEEADIIRGAEPSEIQPQLLDSELIKAIVQDNPNWLKIFFVSDIDLNRYATEWKT